MALRMPDPQGGILPEPTEHARFLLLRVPDLAAAQTVARVAASAPTRTQRLARTDPRSRLVSTVSFGARLWDAASPGHRPRELRPFRALQANGRRAPSTGGDLLLHAVSRRPDLSLDLALDVSRALGDTVEVMDEVDGFRYRDGRDLTGFIDGTENPRGRRRARVALVGEEDRPFAGGSFVLLQRYVHDLERWSNLPVREQEKIIGRRKRDSTELSARARPDSAHINRVVIAEDGEELEIVRHSFPYGTVREAGLLFIAYSRTLDTFEKMLARMMGTSGDGVHDRLMDFTQAVSGAILFAPSLRVLRALGR